MTSADNQKQPAAKSELSLATSQSDTDADADHVTDHNNRPAPPDNGDAALRGGDKEKPMHTIITTDVLKTMFAGELEDYRAAGEDFRRELTHAVMRI
jgi:hypothetical protein